VKRARGLLRQRLSVTRCPSILVTSLFRLRGGLPEVSEATVRVEPCVFTLERWSARFLRAGGRRFRLAVQRLGMIDLSADP